MIIQEGHRRMFALVLANVGWWGAFAWTAALTWVNLSREATAVPNLFQRISGLFIILLMGVGIAAGSALSRMRLSETIMKALEVGYNARSIDGKE